MRRPGKMVREVMRNFFRKAATVRYPFVKVTMPEHFRGKLKFDSANCIGCKLCMKDCPSGAITIRKVADKQFEAEFDFSRCIYCAQCVDSCPRKALEATGDFELAQLNRGKLTVLYTPQIKAAPAPTATGVAAPSTGQTKQD